jgi:hypothetical protein
MHYNTRSLAAYTFTFLLLMAIAIVALNGRRRVAARATALDHAEDPESSPGHLQARTRAQARAESARARHLTNGRGRVAAVAQLSLALGVSVVVVGMSVAFATITHRYDIWLSMLAAEVRAGDGVIDISETDLYNADSSQFSWGWTNPYTSALFQSEYGQGIVLSHVETRDTYTGMTPPMTPEFFDEYHRHVAE